jgi:hypothetical protein
MRLPAYPRHSYTVNEHGSETLTISNGSNGYANQILSSKTFGG